MHAAAPKLEENHTTSLTGAWLLLVALTLASYWFRDHGLAPAAAIVAILVLTFIKVFMVGHSFMELRRAPAWLRLVFATWCGGTCLALVVMAFAF